MLGEEAHDFQLAAISIDQVRGKVQLFELAQKHHDSIMEANPPSYGQATTVNAWDLIADYIPSSDLCSAALVCQQWHATFAPYLWGNPASHFGDGNDRVYGELHRHLRYLNNLALEPWTDTFHHSRSGPVHSYPSLGQTKC